MDDREQEMHLQKQWFRHKLAAEKQKADVVKKVKHGIGEFVLLDARDRVAYANGHIPGAIPMPLDEVESLAEALDTAREHVTYCWNST